MFGSRVDGGATVTVMDCGAGEKVMRTVERRTQWKQSGGVIEQAFT